jgi:hypothetical protein
LVDRRVQMTGHDPDRRDGKADRRDGHSWGARGLTALPVVPHP